MEMLSDKEIVLLQYLLKQSATSALQESTQAKYDALHDKLGRMKSFQQSFAPDTATPCPKCGGELVSLIICLASDCDYKA